MAPQKMKRIKAPDSLCDIAATAIREAIITGRYGLGEAISENSLSELLGISKTPIREALANLRHEGLVSIVPRKGTFVFTMSVDDVAQLGFYRYALESTALDLAMAGHAKELLSALKSICTAMTAARQAGETRKYLELDGQFHQAIVERCGNLYLIEGYQAIAGRTAALRTHLSQHPTHTDKSMNEHVEMIALLEKGDLAAARKVLKQHVTRGERTYADGIEDIATASAEDRVIRRKRSR
ncbi:MAG: GntR family transcriptional regulator [Rhodobacteraceae bacterium]|nr:MAG: GntR family transcriptional regulator [Paracoccaceae bacterium]